MSEGLGRDGMYALPEGSIVAKVDTLRTIQDYAPGGLCMRLVGVSETDFDSAAFNKLQTKDRGKPS